MLNQSSSDGRQGAAEERPSPARHRSRSSPKETRAQENIINPVTVDNCENLDYVPIAKRSCSQSSQVPREQVERRISNQESQVRSRKQPVRGKPLSPIIPTPTLPPGFQFVEAIRNHRKSGVDESREFLIEWCGESDESCWTWEPESNLDGCIQKLTEYCCKHQLDQPDQGSSIAGRSNDTHIRYNPENWVNASQIMSQVKRLSNQELYKMPYRLFNLKEGIDRVSCCVYLDIFWSHAFVYAFDADAQSCRVADGANLYIE